MFDITTIDDEMAGWLTGADEGDTELAYALGQSSWESPGSPFIPAGLAHMEPGLLLAVMLASIDVDALSGHDRVIVMAAYQRMASHYQAQVYASMASVADAVADTLGDEDLELAEAAGSSEIRAALRLTRRAADNELSIARGFQFRLPEVWEALASGQIDRRRANLMLHRTDHLPIEQAREVARQAMELAPELTTGQLTALLRRLCVETEPEEAKQRYESAVDGRRVVLEADVDGTAHLYLLDLPPDRAARIRQRIDAMARDLRRAGETRTMDQLRADVILDMLDPENGSVGSGSRRGAVVMTVDLATLARLAETSGDLGGYGPVIADIARQVADAARGDEWRFVVTDSERRTLRTGLIRRRPTAAARRMVETAYPTCVFPGCRVPAAQCDLDHTTPWVESGRTSVDGLAPGCRHDHVLRHRAGWRYCRTDDGDHEWTSPLGHMYVTRGRSP
jgi:hypothetical protein